MTVKLLTEHHLEFLCLKGSCTGSSESTLVKMPHCWKSHVAAHLSMDFRSFDDGFKLNAKVFMQECLFNITVDVLKFRKLDACQKGLDKQHRHRSDCF